MIRKIFKWVGIVVLIAGATLALERAASVEPELLEPHVAVIRIEGVISESESTLELLEEARNEPMIRGLLLRVNSPGGLVVPSQELHAALRDFPVPVWAFYESLAASGALYATAGADRIGAHSGSIVGSIGVILQGMDPSGLYEKLGLRSIQVKTGPYKDLLSNAELGDDARRIMQQLVDDTLVPFVDALAQGRGLERDSIEAIADGRIFSGSRALELGLVDEISTRLDFERRFADTLDVRPRNILELEPPDSSWFEQLQSVLNGQVAAAYLMAGS